MTSHVPSASFHGKQPSANPPRLHGHVTLLFVRAQENATHVQTVTFYNTSHEEKESERWGDVGRWSFGAQQPACGATAPAKTTAKGEEDLPALQTPNWGSWSPNSRKVWTVPGVHGSNLPGVSHMSVLWRRRWSDGNPALAASKTEVGSVCKMWDSYLFGHQTSRVSLATPNFLLYKSGSHSSVRTCLLVPLLPYNLLRGQSSLLMQTEQMRVTVAGNRPTLDLPTCYRTRVMRSPCKQAGRGTCAAMIINSSKSRSPLPSASASLA